MSLVRAYRLLLSPWLGASCRFEPSCSSYALQALDSHGAAAGTYLTLKRLCRCHPWCEAGYDPVPAREAPLFARFFDARRAAAAPRSHHPLEDTSP